MGLEAFEAEASALAVQVGGLSAGDLSTPTRCGAWDVRTTVAHVVKGLERAVAMVGNPAAGEADPNPLIYYQSARRTDPGRDRVRQTAAAESAARFSTGAELAEVIRDAAAAVRRSVEHSSVDLVVETHWGPVMALEDYLRTRVVEMLVHGIDVADALRAPVWATPSAVADVANLIRALLDDKMPQPLVWSDLDVVRLGTGRRQLTNSERAALGSQSTVFPVIH